jgi:hypothetical protein
MEKFYNLDLLDARAISIFMLERVKYERKFNTF